MFGFQAMRTLSWKPHLGSVTLDVELEDRTITNLTVSPIHAAIILHFQDKSTTRLLFLVQIFVLIFHTGFLVIKDCLR